MRILSLLYILLLISIPTFAKGKAEQPYVKIDDAKYKAVYNLNFIEDTIKRKIKSGYVMLLIGDSCSVYSTINEIKLDSACYTLWKEGASQDQISMQAFKYAMGGIEHQTVYKNYPNSNEISVQHFLIQTSRYNEVMPKLKWTETGVSKEIRGVNCKEAICSYKGRNYVAYYSPDIPISNGPHIFGGLPGLILELSDGNSEYVWTIESFEPSEGMPIIVSNKNIENMTREKYREIDKNIHIKPGLRFPFDKNMMNMKSKPYNPIEKY